MAARAMTHAEQKVVLLAAWPETVIYNITTGETINYDSKRFASMEFNSDGWGGLIAKREGDSEGH
eukprot:4585500-Lingulodinium_polyedra.AAC.1